MFSRHFAKFYDIQSGAKRSSRISISSNILCNSIHHDNGLSLLHLKLYNRIEREIRLQSRRYKQREARYWRFKLIIAAPVGRVGSIIRRGALTAEREKNVDTQGASSRQVADRFLFSRYQRNRQAVRSRSTDPIVSIIWRVEIRRASNAADALWPR